jgi:diguanylate cyclase (GGDEF)-like protein/PAS domain S-box-containing protein
MAARERQTGEAAGLGHLTVGDFEAILDSLPFYVLLVDQDHFIQFANKAVRQRFDVTVAEVQGKHCPAFIHGVEHYPGCPLEDAMAGGATESTHYSEEDGRWMWTTAYPTGVKTEEGRELYFHMVMDVTEETQAREDLAESERRFRRLFEALEDVAFVMSRDGLLEDINRSGLELLQIPSKEEAKRFNLLKDLARLDEGWAPFIETIEATGRVADHEVLFERPDGQVRTVAINANMVTDEAAEGGMVRGIMRDLTRHKELEQLTITDPLTTLYNRGFFEDRLAAQVRRGRSGGSAELSVLFIDIDDFKAYNDTFGHQEGDYVLRRVAESIKLALRDVDIAARYGGEEFAVILACDATTALEIAERVRSNVETMCAKSADGQMDRDVTVSVGAATLGPKTRSAEGLVSLADARMYEAKKLGKNRVC